MRSCKDPLSEGNNNVAPLKFRNNSTFIWIHTNLPQVIITMRAERNLQGRLRIISNSYSDNFGYPPKQKNGTPKSSGNPQECSRTLSFFYQRPSCLTTHLLKLKIQQWV